MSRQDGEGAGDGPSTSSTQNRIRQQAFLQAVMQRGYMAESDAKTLYKRICCTDSDVGYAAFIADISAGISFAGFELRRGKWPGDGLAYVAFVNVVSDDPSKRATRFRTKDGKVDVRLTTFFRALVDKISAHPGPDMAAVAEGAPALGWVTSGEALNLEITLMAEPPVGEDGAGPSQAPTALAGAAAHPLRLGDREHALADFVADGWLARTPGRTSSYSLGPRAYLECRDLLAEGGDAQLAPGPLAAFKLAMGY